PPPKKPASFVFWTLFFIVIISLFFLNLQLIRSNVQHTGLLDRLFNKPDVVEAEDPPPPLPELPPHAPPPAGSVEELPAPATQPEEPPPDAGPVEPPAGTEDGSSRSGPSAPAITPAEPPATAPSVASRDRSLYFIEVDGDGAILRIRVIRPMPATDSPLADTIQLLLQGPTVDERNRGLITLIPPATRFLSAQVRGSTAYLSFSEDFQFNTYGVEGYIGQLRQIIWTATEFPNIADVQILIEGRRIDYLGERIAIGSPLDRNSF
ncbi:MAG: GerMN domain-containing protein, partial [Spirochaetaceae bacterium]|nr:GerMN domain-containing protein [Spirochaetaceae bacterium]